MRGLRWLAIGLVAGLVAALAGCARFDLRQAPDVSGRVVNSRTGEPLVAHLYYADATNEIVVSSADGRFRFPSIRRSYSEVISADRRSARWLVIEAREYKPARRKVDPAAPGDLLIRLDPIQ